MEDAAGKGAGVATMTLRNSSALLFEAMQKHRITREALIFRVAKDECISPVDAGRLVDGFVDGGPCAVVVGAAIISLVVDVQGAR
jgi:hypothetical protein